jgi:hypothetical protein
MTAALISRFLIKRGWYLGALFVAVECLYAFIRFDFPGQCPGNGCEPANNREAQKEIDHEDCAAVSMLTSEGNTGGQKKPANRHMTASSTAPAGSRVQTLD